MRRLIPFAVVLACSISCSFPFWPSKEDSSFSGNWTGTYKNTACAESGAVPFPCAVLTGPTGNFSLTLTQTGNDVAGTFKIDAQSYEATNGAVGTDGSVTLSSTSGSTLAATWTLSRDKDSLTGSLSQTWGSAGGSYTLLGSITKASRAN